MRKWSIGQQAALTSKPTEWVFFYPSKRIEYLRSKLFDALQQRNTKLTL